MNPHDFLDFVPFLMVKGQTHGLNWAEITKTLIASAIIAGVVGYGTMRVAESELAEVKAQHRAILEELRELNEKYDRDSQRVQAIESERFVRKHEIDRRLDNLERRTGIQK